jgi:uncharacterized damage-inducible protein DinB
MHAFYGQFLDQLRLVHEGIEKTIEGLPLEAIDWIPGPEMNSLGILMAHVAGSENHWLGDVVAGEATGRDREAEFRTRGRDAAALLAGLDEMLTYGRSVVAKLQLADLTAERVSHPDGRTMPVGSCLLHILRHAAEHAGHMQITRQIWEARGSA